MKTMKSVVILAILLLSTVTVQGNVNNVGMGTCCFDFLSSRKVMENVVSFVRTHPSCPKKGIIVTTKRGKRVCVDPEHELVSKLIIDMDGRKPGTGNQ